ncbi:hypothetical protein [Cryobacterium tagatosivorans]|uniref:hypothetical protein n=1 Tax=Cryobacterium tagatosivorans TaxID=1259199 RepID=UPI0018E072D4|nr:hypothetical protein [Cryobacterium tagatosivorans]
MTRQGGTKTIRRRPHPAQIVVAGFAGTILIGTALLMLPNAKLGDGGATFLEAIFTATSAVCVTGLPSSTRQRTGAQSARSSSSC